MSGYAMMQLRTGAELEAGQEHIIYIISAYMDAHGLMPCGRGSAERTISFARTGCCWSIFDDYADRLNSDALDGLGKCLTSRLPRAKSGVMAIGVMGKFDTRMLRLYRGGRRIDTYITSPGYFGRIGRWISCKGHAVRWRCLLPEHGRIASLSEAFELGQEDAVSGFDAICEELVLEHTCRYGFSSLEYANIPGIITLYFCTSNRVRQGLSERIFHLTSRHRAAAGASCKFHHQ